MPLSKAEDRDRKRKAAALKREGGTVLLPPVVVRRLRRQGLSITRAFVEPPVTLEDYRDLWRRLEAKAQRVEWQSSGIKMLREQIATLEARLATMPAMEETMLAGQVLEAQQRITLLEATQVLQGMVEPSKQLLGGEGLE